MDPVFLTDAEKKEVRSAEKILVAPRFFYREIEGRLSPCNMYFNYSRPKGTTINGDEAPIDISIFRSTSIFFYERFIELLPSLFLRLFSFTSKTNYRECMNLRGLEVEFLFYGKEPECIPYNPRILPARNGRLYIDLEVLEPRFYPYLQIICFSCSSTAIHPNIYIGIPKNYQYLILEWFSKEIPPYIHPGVKTVAIIRYSSSSISEFLKHLNNIEELALAIVATQPLFVQIIDWLNKKPLPIKKFYLSYMRWINGDWGNVEGILRGNKLIEIHQEYILNRCVATITNSLFE